MKQVLGWFEVEDGNGILQPVLVSQECFIDVHGVVVDHRKVYSLNEEEGEELFTTEDPRILVNRAGIKFKKKGPIKNGKF